MTHHFTMPSELEKVLGKNLLKRLERGYGATREMISFSHSDCVVILEALRDRINLNENKASEKASEYIKPMAPLTDADFEAEWQKVIGKTFRPKEQARHFFMAGSTNSQLKENEGQLKRLSNEELDKLAQMECRAGLDFISMKLNFFKAGYRAAEARILRSE